MRVSGELGGRAKIDVAGLEAGADGTGAAGSGAEGVWAWIAEVIAKARSTAKMWARTDRAEGIAEGMM